MDRGEVDGRVTEPSAVEHLLRRVEQRGGPVRPDEHERVRSRISNAPLTVATTSLSSQARPLLVEYAIGS
jgi:hypothetical protein